MMISVKTTTTTTTTCSFLPLCKSWFIMPPSSQSASNFLAKSLPPSLHATWSFIRKSNGNFVSEKSWEMMMKSRKIRQGRLLLQLSLSLFLSLYQITCISAWPNCREHAIAMRQALSSPSNESTLIDALRAYPLALPHSLPLHSGH